MFLFSLKSIYEEIRVNQKIYLQHRDNFNMSSFEITFRGLLITLS